MLKQLENNIDDIFITCGLGDLFYYAQLFDLYRDRFNYNIDIDFILKYRKY